MTEIWGTQGDDNINDVLGCNEVWTCGRWRTDVSEEHIGFRAIDLLMEAVTVSEISVNFYANIWQNIPEVCHINF